MRHKVLVFAVLVTAGPAYAQFWGGVADGVESANRLELQRRALELDAKDGGRRLQDLQTQQSLEDIRREQRRTNELLEDAERRRRVLGR